MPIFDYTALDANGHRLPGTIDAPNRDLAIEKLQSLGMIPLVCELMKEPTNVEDLIARFRVVPQTTLVYFSRQLAVMIGAGMSPVHSLTVMEEQEENPKFKDILGDIIGRVEAGETMHESFGEHPEVFGKLYTAMLRAGEESGNLANALNELATQLEKALRLRRAVKSAAYYPVIMGCVAFVVISVLLIVIVPEFGKLFVQTVHETETKNPLTGKYPNSTALPAPTRFVESISQIIYPSSGGPTLSPITVGSFGYWFIQFHPFSIGAFMRLFIAVACLYGLFRGTKRLLREEGPRFKWDAFWLNAPLHIGPLIQKLVVARFARTFASLLRSGVPAQEAMTIVADTAGNAVVARAVLEARERMLAGSNIADPLARSGVFPNMVTRMIEVGEETGQLELMLIKVAEFFEEEVEMAVKGLISIIEPVMILAIGLCIGFIIISCYLPMFDLYNLVGTGPSGTTGGTTAGTTVATASLLVGVGPRRTLTLIAGDIRRPRRRAS